MSGQQSKASLINERQSNLDLPESPPVASDWTSLDARNVNIGAGGNRQEEIPKENMSGSDPRSTAGLREPASEGSGVREAGGVNMSGIGRQEGKQSKGDGTSRS